MGDPVQLAPWGAPGAVRASQTVSATRTICRPGDVPRGLTRHARFAIAGPPAPRMPKDMGPALDLGEASKGKGRWANPAALCVRRRDASLDHLVRSHQDRLRHGEAERLGGLQVDNQLKFGWLLNRQVGRLCALEDFSSIDTELAIYIDEAGSKADQPAGRGKLAPRVDRWNCCVRCVPVWRA